jgi:hypothetical protein
MKNENLIIGQRFHTIPTFVEAMEVHLHWVVDQSKVQKDTVTSSVGQLVFDPVINSVIR